MEWTGWNVLLEGEKLWTFLPPSSEFDEPLGTYRLAPNAFGSHNLSAGWQSNLDLYQRGVTTNSGTTCASWPTKGEGEEVMRHAVSGVQKQGDLILIPPRHWHQVNLSPPNSTANLVVTTRIDTHVCAHLSRPDATFVLTPNEGNFVITRCDVGSERRR